MKQAPSPSSAGGPRLTAKFVRDALTRVTELRVKPTGREPAEFSSVTTDSRKVPKGSLFVAIRGETFDGHQFIAKAIKAGAAGAIGDTDPPEGLECAYYKVSDSVGAFRALAASWRAAFDVPLAGVAGSNGKTTSKELLAAILSGKFRDVLKTQGSQNGFVGIPMTLLELKPDHRAAIVEIGIDEVGAMDKHLEIVRPNAALLTSIGPEHLEKLGNVDTVAREEAMALERTHRDGGLVAIHLDDPYIRPLWEKLSGGKRVGYTLSPDAKDSPEIYRGFLSPDGKSLSVRGGKLAVPMLLPLPLLGRHNAMNLLGAVALSLGLGLSPEQIKKGLATFQGVEGRSQVRELPDGTILLCDYYNASPASVSAGLDLLLELSKGPMGKRRRFACLADMKELGPDEEKFHRGLAAKIIEQKVDNVLLFGDKMKHLHDELKTRGFRGERLEHFNTREDLSNALAGSLRPGNVALIKGSHSMKMEEVYEALRRALKLP
jgi:UDP-N-acetylmuramoyl-tripeptide--D-alanyl-D-alanine ligase